MPMRYLAGDAEDVRRQIDDLAERGQADEVMITTMLPGRQDRERTITHLARAFGLRERGAPNMGAERVAV